MYNYNAIKYFIYITSLDNNLYLPIEVRKIIWQQQLKIIVMYYILYNTTSAIKF